jgi:hypothetical protein
MADSTYHFEEGALADFEIDSELVKLVATLFSNTPLRTEGVQKLQREHIVGRTSSGLIRDPALDIHYFF